MPSRPSPRALRASSCGWLGIFFVLGCEGGLVGLTERADGARPGDAGASHGRDGAGGGGIGPGPGGAAGRGPIAPDAGGGRPGSPDGGAGDAGGGDPGGGGGGAGSAAPDAAAPAATIPVTFRTTVGGQLLSAAGGALGAAPSVVGTAETFALTDVNAGALEDGDPVHLAAGGGQYVTAVGGGGGELTVAAAQAGADETFTLVRLAGAGAIVTGDRVALRTRDGTHYVSAIDGGGGAVRADAPWARGWEIFTITLVGTPPPPRPAPRQRVLDYLASVSGRRTIAGQQNKFSWTPTSHTDQVRGITGRQPGLWSADFGFGSGAVDGRGAIVEEAKRQWRQGAVVQLMYHNCIPTRDELCGWDDIGGAHPQHLSDAQWNELVTDGTALNRAWKGRLDALSPFFADLKAAGVAPLFRPLHEMNQGVFWWGGRGGPSGTRKLWQITHDYLVRDKGFDHLIWVWNIQDFGSLRDDATAYNPGPAYYDLASLDVYDGGYEQWKYDVMRGASAGKPIAIGECARIPTASELARQPDWVFFMLWPDFIAENADVLPGVYGADNVLTQDEMPGWE